MQAEIDQGFASTRSALRNPDAVAPFFRIPGLLRAERVEKYLRSRGMVTWSADVVADDWKHITASEVVSRAIARLDARGKGILLLHDIQPATALALAAPAARAQAPRLQDRPGGAGKRAAGRKRAAQPDAGCNGHDHVTTTVVPKQQPQPQTKSSRSAKPRSPTPLARQRLL